MVKVSTIGSKLQSLKQYFKEQERVAIAFSGGVDSTFLLSVAMEVLGKENVTAITCRSSVLARSEISESIRLGKELGTPHRMIDVDPLQNPEFVKNPENRCYLCKRAIFGQMIQLVKEEKLGVLMEGSQADDERDYRPGRRALEELDIKSPLSLLRFTKEEIRSLSQERGLTVWNKPSLACLASRIPYGSEISYEKLRRVEEAEDAIRALGFFQVRVRNHGTVARIEIEDSELSRWADPKLRQVAVSALKQVGFTYVTLDLEGYRTGAMNEASLIPF